MLGIVDENKPKSRKGKQRGITFKEEEDVINPEDIDPTVGKFRNLVTTSIIIPTKKAKLSHDIFDERSFTVHRAGSSNESANSFRPSYNPLLSNSMSIKLGIQLPNPTPDFDEDDAVKSETVHEGLYDEPHDVNKKKKYVKEAWPGKKPGLL